MQSEESSSEQILSDLKIQPCELHRDEGKYLSEICINKDCSQRFKLSCIDCIKINHKDQKHGLEDFISLKNFLRKLHQLTEQRPTCEGFSKILKPELERLLKQQKQLLIKMDELREQIFSRMESIIKLIGEEEDYIKQQLEQNKQIKEQQYQFYELKERSQMDEFLKTIHQYLNVTEVTESNFKLELKSAQQENQKNQYKIQNNQQYCQIVCNKLQVIEESIDKFNQYFDFKNELFHPIPEFSQTLKHQDIEIIGRCQVQTSSLFKCVFCFSEGKLPNNQNSTWAFKIISSSASNGILLGLAHLDLIQQQGFQVNINGSLNGGYYLLYGDKGATATHWKQEEHNKNQGLRFSTGDTIYILFQPQNKKIYFCKNKNQPYASITLHPDREDYQPCVVLFTPDNTVQIQKNDEYEFEL